MSDNQSWFETQKTKGLVDFKCAIGRTDSSYSIADKDLKQMQALIDSGTTDSPREVLRPDLPTVAAMRANLPEKF